MENSIITIVALSEKSDLRRGKTLGPGYIQSWNNSFDFLFSYYY